MCCCYWLDESPKIIEIVDEMMRSPLVRRWLERVAVKQSGEIRPTDVVPVIAPDRRGNRAVFPMKWGYTGQSLLINARSETAAEKPTFKEDWASHRCIIPASWYYEWEHKTDNNGKVHTGDKYLIQPRESEITWLCGLYRIENNLPVFVILTREPTEEIRFIHDRMPLILPEQYVPDWIKPDADPAGIVKEAVNDVVFEKETG